MRYFNGTLVSLCHCGAEPRLYGEGTALEEYYDTGDKEMYFVDFYGYTVSCTECDTEAHSFKSLEEAIQRWNEMMED